MGLKAGADFDLLGTIGAEHRAALIAALVTNIMIRWTSTDEAMYTLIFNHVSQIVRLRLQRHKRNQDSVLDNHIARFQESSYNYKFSIEHEINK